MNRLLLGAYAAIFIFSLVKFSEADVITNNDSSWTLWSLYRLDEGDGGKVSFHIEGDSNVDIKNAANSLVSLGLGVKVNQDNNFTLLKEANNQVSGSLFLNIDINDNNNLKFGYLPEDFANFAILKRRGYIKGLNSNVFYSLIDKNPANANLILFDGAYVFNNNAVAISYQKTFLLNNLKIGVEYIPNFKNNFSTSNVSFFDSFDKVLGATQTSVDYYNEYNALGYGVIAVARTYLSNISYKGYDFMVSPNIDYLGIGLMVNLMNGKINHNQVKLNYTLREVILSYSLLRASLGLDYNFDTISGNFTNKYSIHNLSFYINYIVNPKVNLKLAFFQERLAANKPFNGFALGLNFKV